MTDEEIQNRISMISLIRGLLLYYSVSEFFIHPIREPLPFPPTPEPPPERTFLGAKPSITEVPKLQQGFIVSMPDYLMIENAPYCIGQMVVYKIGLSIPFPYVSEMAFGDKGLKYQPEIVSIVPGGVIAFEKDVSDLITMVNSTNTFEREALPLYVDSIDPAEMKRRTLCRSALEMQRHLAEMFNKNISTGKKKKKQKI